MTQMELLLCMSTVLTTTVTQLCLKKAANSTPKLLLLILIVSGLCMVFSVLALVWVLRTLQLTQIVPFAACAYITVPLCESYFFKKKLGAKFWLGIVTIITGIYLIAAD